MTTDLAQKPKVVTLLQVTLSLASTIIGVGILAFPRITVNYTKTGAPLATLFAAILILLGGLMLAYLGNQYVQKTLFEYADEIVGKWVGGIITLAFSLYFLELAALSAREFGEVVVTVVLPRTPLEITILIMIFLAVIASRSDIAVFGRILAFYMPVVYIPVLIIDILTLKNAQFTNIMPVLAVFNETSVKHMVRAMLVVAALFQNFVIVGLFIPFMYQPRKVWKGVLVGIGAAGIFYVILIFATLAVFGLEEMHNLIWPTLELVKTAALPMFFIERLDPIIVAVWVTTVFTGLLSSYYVAIQGMAHLFRFHNHKVLTLLPIPVIFILSLQPPNIVALYQTVEKVGIVGLFFTLGYPFVLLITHFIRKRLIKRQEKGQMNAA